MRYTETCTTSTKDSIATMLVIASLGSKGGTHVFYNGDEVFPSEVTPSESTYVLRPGFTLTTTELPKPRKCNERLHGPQSKDRWR